MALRPRLSPGVPSERDDQVLDVRFGTSPVKQGAVAGWPSHSQRYVQPGLNSEAAGAERMVRTLAATVASGRQRQELPCDFAFSLMDSRPALLTELT